MASIRIAFLLILSAVSLSCLPDFGDDPTYISFRELRVSQVSTYLRVRGFKYGDTTSNVFAYVPDTLVVRVIGKDQTGFIFEDYLTEGSPRQLSPEDKSRFTYHVSISGNLLQVHGISHLFWSIYGDLTLQLSQLPNRYFTVSGWKVSDDPLRDESSGYAFDLRILGHDYHRVMLYYRHFEADVDLQPDIPYYCGYRGKTIVYSEEYGVIRSRWVSLPNLDEGLCWDLIR